MPVDVVVVVRVELDAAFICQLFPLASLYWKYAPSTISPAPVLSPKPMYNVYRFVGSDDVGSFIIVSNVYVPLPNRIAFISVFRDARPVAVVPVDSCTIPG